MLVVEDNPDLSKLIQAVLTQQGYVVDAAARADDAEQAAMETSYDAIILDRMLPDREGSELCASLRQRRVTTPILMLTGLSAIHDKVAGLDAGADDYLTKPFESDELIARIRSLLRRGLATESSILRFEDIELDLTRRATTRAGRPVKLSRTQFSLLEYFIRNAERALTRKQIAEHVWSGGATNGEGSGNMIEVHVAALRRRLSIDHQRPVLHTLIGVGYILSASPHYSKPISANGPA